MKLLSKIQMQITQMHLEAQSIEFAIESRDAFIRIHKIHVLVFL